jgi:dipeptidase D
MFGKVQKKEAPMKTRKTFAISLMLLLLGQASFDWTGKGLQAAEVTGGLPQRVSLQDAAPSMEPEAVWKQFLALTQIPRPSHHEEQISRFMADFGRSLGLETIVDDLGNVIIRKGAAPGMENRKPVVLQAHMDMVAQKTPDKVHDFEKDPIEAYVEGDWVRADRTTLGADDGIGMALIMAILESKTIAHGPLEALFTVNEEDGFSGVNGLAPGLLRGEVFINVDSEEEGALTIGSAGGMYVEVEVPFKRESLEEGMAAYEIKILGLKGGHSGVDINLGRGNANRLLVRWLRNSQTDLGARISGIRGGDRPNAITREASAVVCLPKANEGALIKSIQDYDRMLKMELSDTEPGVAVEALPCPLPSRVMDAKTQQTLMNAVHGSPNGVIRMSYAVDGLVETSTSQGVLEAQNGTFKTCYFVRSDVDSARDDVGQMIESIYSLAGIKVQFSSAYSGWKPDPSSPVLSLMKRAYLDLFGREAKVVAVHAGLETSVIGAKYPKMDMISIGPTISDAHSPDERLNVQSVQRVYDLLIESLKRMPENA